MRILLLVALGLVLATCGGMQRARDAAQGVVGMSKADVLACAGAPTRMAAADGIEVMTYALAEVDDGPVVASRFGNTIVATGGASTDSCHVNVVIESGRATRISLSGNAAYLCRRVLGNCGG